MRAVCYARVSSKVQKDRQTVENQLRVLPGFVAAQGWTLAMPADTYVDDGRTAKAGHLGARGGLTRLMKDAGAGLFDVVAVVDLDRLTRSEDITERGAVLGAFQRAGIRIAIATSGQVLDLASSMGDLFSGLQAFFAAEENRKRRERTVAGKLRAIAEGRKPSGPSPFGYAYSRAAGWSIDGERAAAVRRIFASIATGSSCESVARELEDTGAPRPRGGRWSMSRVYQIARARTYLGEWTADRARGLTVKVPALVDEATWLAASRSLVAHRKRGLNRTKHVYLLAGGVAHCELCGSRISVASGSGPGADRLRRTYYACRGRHRPDRRDGERCNLRFHEVAPADARVWTAVEGILRRKDLLERALDLRSDEARGTKRDWQRGGEAAVGRLERLARTETALLARFRRGVISEAAMDAELEAQARERLLLERQVAAARRAGAGADLEHGAIAELHATVEGLRRRLGRTTAEERRDLVAALLGERGVVVGPEAISAVLRLRAGGAESGLVSAAAAGSRTPSETRHALVLEFRLVA